MYLDIIGGSYKSKYLAVNSERTINWYIDKVVIDIQKDLYKSRLFPTPGLADFSDTTKTNLRGIFTARNLTSERCFVVADNYLYEIDSAGVATSRGQMTDVTNDTTPVFMECNPTQVFIGHSSASYIFTLGTNGLAKVTDVDFPSGVTSLSYMDGYFIITSGGRVYYSDLNDGSSWTGSSVFTPTSKADSTLHAVCWRDDVHCFSAETIETYINDGTNPFSKAPRSTINIGLFSASSLSLFYKGMIFVGKAREGEANIYMYNGQDCIPIAPPEVTWYLNNTTPPLTGITSFIEYSKDGHILYHCTISALNTTYIYDLTSNEWTERQSLNPNSSAQGVFRGIYFTNFKGLNLFTDLYTGHILKEDYTIATEKSGIITRTRITHVTSEEQKNISLYSLEIETNPGNGTIANSAISANIVFSYSKDGGNTFGTTTNLSLGTYPNFNTRPRIHKLGSARKWVFKFVVTDAADIVIQHAIIHGTIGTY